MAFGPGTRLGPYEVLMPLGAGGMGEVYRARDTRLDRDVALKILPDVFASDVDRLTRFEREAKTLASLNHPHIAQIYGVEESGTSVPPVRALIMELVDGEDLSQRVARGPMPLDEAVPIARQIADAVEAAHEQGVIHRDLKPANVKVRADGSIKVLDFGLAKALHPSSATGTPAVGGLADSPTVTTPAMTHAGVILGTAAYMAPEQARGRTVDRRADIWAFGVILYEMLTGHHAFGGETITDVLAAVVSREPEWHRLPSDTPASLEQLLRRCLEKDPRQRLRDIGEARVALAQFSDANVKSETRNTPGVERRAAAWIPWSVAAAATLVAIAVWMLRPSVDPPVRKLELSLPSNGVFALSPDGTRVGGRVGDRILVIDFVRLERHELTASQSTQRSAVFWSPDSVFLGFNDGDGKLWIVPASGGTPRLVCVIPETRQLVGATWRRDGSIVFAVWRGSLYSVSASGGEPAAMLQIDSAAEIDFHEPTSLPDGKLLVATHLRGGDAQRERYRIELVDGGRRAAAIEGPVDAVPFGFDSGHLLLLRFEVHQGIWGIPYNGTLPLRMNDGYLVAPGAWWSNANGGSLLFSLESDGPRPRELVWVDRAGDVVNQVGPARVDLFAPALSPDGRRAAFSARSGDDHDVWIRDLQSHVDTRVTSDTGRRILPTWFPSGARVAYSEVGVIGMERVAASASDGSGGRRELTRGFSAVVAPDGRYLAYLIDERGEYHARYSAIGPDGAIGPPQPLLKIDPETSIHGLSFSPDTRLVAYVERQPGGAMEVFVTKFPSSEGRWQISNGGGRSPVWSRGGELFFIAGSNDGAKQMMAVPVTAGAAPAVGTPMKLFSLSDDLYARPFIDGLAQQSRGPYDVTPDGKRFLMVRMRAGIEAPRRWILVQNWRSEF